MWFFQNIPCGAAQLSYDTVLLAAFVCFTSLTWDSSLSPVCLVAWETGKLESK